MHHPKSMIDILPAPSAHWVGDGFPVRSMFSIQAQDPAAISPFLLLDYAGPYEFEPDTSGQPRGVDAHPHRGFETVTIVYQGELEHRDSGGHEGKIGPGDVQWMTAASGVVHEEKHAARFTRAGGTLEMIQLWVNLPTREKMAAPRYQEILNDSIPVLALSGGAGSLRLIAGAFEGKIGPARTVTAMNLWDIELVPDRSMTLAIPEGHNLLLMVREGEMEADGRQIDQHQCAIFSRTGDEVVIKSGRSGVKLCLLSGEPIDEPVVAHGPFVMNSEQEIREAIADFRHGRMGVLDSESP